MITQVNVVFFLIACEQALLFGRVKRCPLLARSREARFACPNRRACSQAIFLTASEALITRLRMRHLHIQFQLSDLRNQKWQARIQLMNLIKFARFTYSLSLDRTVKNLDPRSSMHLFAFTVKNERFDQQWQPLHGT